MLYKTEEDVWRGVFGGKVRVRVVPDGGVPRVVDVAFSEEAPVAVVSLASILDAEDAGVVGDIKAPTGSEPRTAGTRDPLELTGGKTVAASGGAVLVDRLVGHPEQHGETGNPTVTRV
jgi:hypothetical protein